SFISPDDTWVLWMFINGWAAVSSYLEQRFAWASQISGAIIALLGAVLLYHLGIILTATNVYVTVWHYVVPLALQLFLFESKIQQIWKKSGRLLIIFLFSSIATVAGAIIAFLSFKDYIPYIDKITAMMTGSYTGGGVNFAAMSAKFETPGEM